MEGEGVANFDLKNTKAFCSKLLPDHPSQPPPPPTHPALLAVTQIFHHEQNQQMSVELICDPVMDGEKPPFATE